jgi:hypothetical protein
MIGDCAARVRAPRAVALDDALAEARIAFAAQVSPEDDAAWERALQMLRGEPPPSGAWAVVLTELATPEDGHALMALAAQGELYADDDELSSIEGAGSTRGIAELIAVQLTSNGDDTVWQQRDFVPWISGVHSTREEIDAFVTRCREAGVTLGPRASSDPER